MTGVCRIEPLSGEADLVGAMQVDAESFPAPWTRAMYESELAQPDVCFFVVARTDRSAVAGYCAFRLVVDEMHISNVAVRPSCRKQGIGRRLVEEVLRRASDRRCHRVLLEVRSVNVAARKLYESLGFSAIGIRRGYYDKPADDAVVLACDIQIPEPNPNA